MIFRQNLKPLHMSHKPRITRTSFISSVTPPYSLLNLMSVELFFQLLGRVCSQDLAWLTSCLTLNITSSERQFLTSQSKAETTLLPVFAP